MTLPTEVQRNPLHPLAVTLTDLRVGEEYVEVCSHKRHTNRFVVATTPFERQNTWAVTDTNGEIRYLTDTGIIKIDGTRWNHTNFTVRAADFDQVDLESYPRYDAFGNDDELVYKYR